MVWSWKIEYFSVACKPPPLNELDPPEGKINGPPSEEVFMRVKTEMGSQLGDCKTDHPSMETVSALLHPPCQVLAFCSAEALTDKPICHQVPWDRPTLPPGIKKIMMIIIEFILLLFLPALTPISSTLMYL